MSDEWEQPERCRGLCASSQPLAPQPRCTRRAKRNGLCAQHARIEADRKASSATTLGYLAAIKESRHG